jgi:transcriptional regulator with XRE-family HTH domain
MLLSRDELAQLRQQQKSNREIAEIFKISEAFVTYLMRKYEIEKVQTVPEVPVAASCASPVAVSAAPGHGHLQTPVIQSALVVQDTVSATETEEASAQILSASVVSQNKPRKEREKKINIDRNRLIELQQEHKTDKRIAEVLGISQLYVFHLRKKFNVQAIKRTRNLEQEITREKLLDLQQQYKTDAEIAKQLNISVLKVASLRRKYELAPLKREVRENKYSISREELIELQKEHKSDRKIAEVIGKSLSYVFQMRKHYNIPIYHKFENDKVIDLKDDRKVNFLFNKLIEIRRDQKLKQYEFAKKIGISDAHLRKFEHGMKYPRIYILLKLMNEFKVNPNYLFIEDETQKYIADEE